MNKLYTSALLSFEEIQKLFLITMVFGFIGLFYAASTGTIMSLLLFIISGTLIDILRFLAKFVISNDSVENEED